MHENGTSLAVIDIDAMVRPVARVKIGGETYTVLPINGRCMEMLGTVADQRGRNEPIELLHISQAIVADAVPDLPVDQRDRLTMEQLTNLISIATGVFEQVKEQLAAVEGNAEGPVPVMMSE